MALDTLPEFLTNFTPPVQAISQGAAAGARDYANALAAQELALKQEQMLRQEQARQAELQEQAQRFQLQQQAAAQRAGIDLGRLDVARAKQSQDSGMAARRFQATQDIQAAIAAGEDPVAAITRFLPGMSEGTPGALGSLAGRLMGEKTTQARNADIAKQAKDSEAGRDSRDELKREATAAENLLKRKQKEESDAGKKTEREKAITDLAKDLFDKMANADAESSKKIGGPKATLTDALYRKALKDATEIYNTQHPKKPESKDQSFKKGDKAYQRGVLYEFDGKDWVEVKK